MVTFVDVLLASILVFKVAVVPVIGSGVNAAIVGAIAGVINVRSPEEIAAP